MSKIGKLFIPDLVDAGQFCARKMVSKRIQRFKIEEAIEEERIEFQRNR